MLKIYHTVGVEGALTTSIASDNFVVGDSVFVLLEPEPSRILPDMPSSGICNII